MSKGFITDFRRFFLRGLIALLPILLTFALIIWVVNFLYGPVIQPINRWVLWGVSYIWEIYGGTTPEFIEDNWNRFFWWVGVLAIMLFIYIFGRLVASFLGRGIWRLMEDGFLRLPVVKQLYPYIKQVIEYILSEKKLDFSRVVAVEYPRKGIWSIGLVTGVGMSVVRRRMDADILSVFIPSSPTPFTGYAIMVRRDEIVDLNISIDDALRFVVSGGVIVPPSSQPTQLELQKAVQASLPTNKTKETIA